MLSFSLSSPRFFDSLLPRRHGAASSLLSWIQAHGSRLMRHTLDPSSIPHPRTQLLAHLTLRVSKFLAYQGFWVSGSPTIAGLLCFGVAMMPWYSVYDPWIIETAAIMYIKEVWHFAKKSILVVLDPQGKVASRNALHIVRIWGNHAFPFTSEKEDALWKLENWKLDLLVYGIDVEIPHWIAKGRVVCLYGGEDINWIRKFTTTAKAVAEAAGINLELVYEGKNNAKERLKKNIASINAEQLSHYWPDISSVSLFWARLESMLYSKLQKTVENCYIMQEVLTMLSFDGCDQGWAILFRGSDEMARAN